MHTMAQRESRHQLSGQVEIDDAYLAGERPGRRGRGSPNKVPFVSGVSIVGDNRAHHVVIRCTPFTKNAINHWADTQGSSTGLLAFGELAEEVPEHYPIITGSEHAAAEHADFRCVNIDLGNLKTEISGFYHTLNFAKYAPRFLAIFQYRVNRRYNLRFILLRLARAVATAKPCAESPLRLAEFAN